MPVNAINFVLTKTVLDQAVEDTGKEQTEEQTKDISRASIVSALTPGNLGLFVPFIVRDSIVGEDGKGEGEGETGGSGDDVENRLDDLEASVGATKEELEGIRSDLKDLNDKVDRLLSANQAASRGPAASQPQPPGQNR